MEFQHFVPKRVVVFFETFALYIHPSYFAAEGKRPLGALNRFLLQLLLEVVNPILEAHVVSRVDGERLKVFDPHLVDDIDQLQVCRSSRR